MKVFASPHKRRRGILIILLTIGVLSGLYLLIRSYAPLIFQPEELRVWVGQFGILSPVVFMLLQIVQVIFAPIPGQALALIAGYLFGPIAGTFYSLGGVLLGSAIAFSMSKRYGRSFVEDMIHADLLTRFDEFVDTVGIPGLIAFVIIPGLPDDVICFLAGLTDWKLRKFMFAIVIGRIPAYILTVYAGGELATGRFIEGMSLIGIIILISALGYYKQEAIQDWIGRLDI